MSSGTFAPVGSLLQGPDLGPQGPVGGLQVEDGRDASQVQPSLQQGGDVPDPRDIVAAVTAGAAAVLAGVSRPLRSNSRSDCSGTPDSSAATPIPYTRPRRRHP